MFNLKKDLKFLCNVSILDIFLILLFPILLFLLMFIPENIHNILILNIHSPSWWQLFTNAFMHVSWSHFQGNVIGYFVFIIPTYLIMLRNNSVKKLFKLLFWVILITPIITSILEIIIYPRLLPNIASSQGASGIVGALMGTMLMFFIYDLYLKSKKIIEPNGNILVIGICIAGLIVSTIYYRNYHNPLIIIGLIILILFCSIIYRSNFKKILYNLKEENKQSFVNSFLTLIVLMGFLIAPSALFPLQIASSGGLIDIIVHYGGLTFGIMFSYYYLFGFVKQKTIKKSI